MSTGLQSDNDTIVSVATPAGRGGIGIVRLSGPDAGRICGEVIGKEATDSDRRLVSFRDENGGVIDHGLVLFFPSPHSFTGEDVSEFHAHGSPVVLDELVSLCLRLGARIARPGEYSERAFLNDKLDLAQAEAIADLIDSSTRQAARAAVNSLQGAFSDRIHQLQGELTGLRTYVEASIDFPDEDIDFLTEGKIGERLAAIRESIADLLREADQGSLLINGLRIVIAGAPNAGKSSLLNRLSGEDSAIVTDIPGTTRDAIRVTINLDGLPLHVVDTAGLRDNPDSVERIGIEKTHAEIERADHVLYLIDTTARQEAGENDLTDREELVTGTGQMTVVLNKIDLSGERPGMDSDTDPVRVYLSAKTGDGLEMLRSRLKAVAGYQATGEALFTARRRHLDALVRAEAHLAEAAKRLDEFSAELIAEELSITQKALGEITGEYSSEDLLGDIFGSFCIGK